ncbi:MAG: LysM peptidoglycan-binding domain-containing protein [Cyclobacteriaceae bacterium]|nr:LysM peptidoglycan-binding domain-containing protein [Cyclobacteriaceae bacterium]
MKFFAPALIFCGAAAFGQSPQVPAKMQFAGLTLTIRDDARREIQKDVDALTLHPKYFNIKVERARTYFPIIEKIFADERLPEDFKYLALQESALIPDAVSSSNAVGFWQFKESTAHEVGLRVDKEIDERMNIASASRGAARYLKQCNHYFNNWVYALQSYQMGAGGVMRAVGDKDIGGRHMEINAETYWYVKKFIAHKVAFENATSGKGTIEVTRVASSGGKTLQEISAETSVDEQKLRDFNKWLKTERIPVDKEYAVLIPNGDGVSDFGVLTIASTAKTKPSTEATSIQAQEKIEVNGVPVIRAIKGETPQSIATRAGISISSFLHYNDMEIDRPVKAGELYFLEKKKKKADEELYTLKAGEDIWLVSQRFGVQEKSILRFNKLEKGSRVSSGVTLYLNNRKPAGVKEDEDDGTIAVLDEDDSFNWDQPGSKKTTAVVVPLASITKQSTPVEVITDIPVIRDVKIDSVTVSGPSVSIHEVKSSDTLYSVARQYGVTIKELMDWNEKKDFALSVGEKLKVRSR